MTDKVFDLDVPLYHAIDTMNSSPPAAVTNGNVVSGTAPTTLTFTDKHFSINQFNKELVNNGVIGFVPLISHGRASTRSVLPSTRPLPAERRGCSSTASRWAA